MTFGGFSDILDGFTGMTRPEEDGFEPWINRAALAGGVDSSQVAKEYIKMLEAGKSKANARRIVEAKYGSLS